MISAAFCYFITAAARIFQSRQCRANRIFKDSIRSVSDDSTDYRCNDVNGCPLKNIIRLIAACVFLTTFLPF
jgi:hypothetical protein